MQPPPETMTRLPGRKAPAPAGRARPRENPQADRMVRQKAGGTGQASPDKAAGARAGSPQRPGGPAGAGWT